MVSAILNIETAMRPGVDKTFGGVAGWTAHPEIASPVSGETGHRTGIRPSGASAHEGDHGKASWVWMILAMGSWIGFPSK